METKDKSLFFEAMENCVNDFIRFYNEDKYISKSEYDDFLDKYHDVFRLLSDYREYKDEDVFRKVYTLSVKGSIMIEKHNKDFIERSLKKHGPYFDNMFNSIDPSIKLDKEQRTAILNDEDYSLIIAGAGSGKTTTMAAKAKYLVEKCNVDPKSILMISFTNKAVDELSERVKKDMKINCSIKTFHSLGSDLIRAIDGRKITTIDDSETFKLIYDYMKNDVFKDHNRMSKMLSLFNNYLRFDEEWQKFDSFEEYCEYKKNKTFIAIRDQLSTYNKQVIDNRKKYYRTINSEYLRSSQEVSIANFLFMNGIEYEYEKVYPYPTETGKPIRPDFYIEQGENKAYIEHFGISEDGKNNRFDDKSLNNYIEQISLKRKQHIDYGTTLIETYSSYNDGRKLLEHLEEELKRHGFILKPVNDKKIYEKLMNTNSASYFADFIRFVLVYINKRKTENIKDIKVIIDRINKSYEDKDISLEQKEFLIEEVNTLEDIYLYYERKLKELKKIDFNDMINISYENIDTIKESDLKVDYKYIIIDEYQDISRQRHNLTKKLSEFFDAKVIAVGDDWQSIFAFSGSSIKMFTGFRDLMGYGSELKITRTYRNCQEIIDLAGSFVMKNQSQIKKDLISSKHIDKPVMVYRYNDTEYGKIKTNRANAISSIIYDVYKANPKSNILLIGRYNSDLYKLLDTDLFSAGKGDSVICKACPKAKVDFLTVHKSKGLGYDQVIIVNAIDSKFGFPSKIKDDILFCVCFPTDKEDTAFAEERRLFYVAMTRTKNKVFIITPSGNPSPFVEEIKNHTSVETHPVIFGQDVNERITFECPICNMPLEEIMDNDVGSIVYRCTNEKEICDFVTNNIERKIRIRKCPMCDGLLIDKGIYDGKVLLGCTNYEENKYGSCQAKVYIDITK